MRIEGKVALVTGADRGLGRALALELSRRGARLIASGLSIEPLQELRGMIEAAGGRVMARSCDIRDPVQIATLVAEATHTFGGLDLLINNAGISRGGDIR